MKTAIVFGAGGFIGSHLVRKLKEEGCWVRGVDLKHPEFSPTAADEFVIGDLRRRETHENTIREGADTLYQLAADMGGAGYLFTGENDAQVMHNSALINLHAAEIALKRNVGKLFFSSSACIYPRINQTDPTNPKCSEDSAYPADPDSEYGWEKLFSERLFQAFHKNHGLNIRIARFHNVYGPDGAYEGGREKAPAALCRKVAGAPDGGSIEIWGDGTQTRSFLCIDDCLAGIQALMDSEVTIPLNVGSEEMISLMDFAKMIIGHSGKRLGLRTVPGPVGVMGRKSDNRLVEELTGWRPEIGLDEGSARLFEWIRERVAAREKA